MPTFSLKTIKVFAIVWLSFISILFFLLGSALPKDKIFDVLSFDKWVHFGLFAVLLFLWRFYLPVDNKYNWWLLLTALCYGFSVEVIQYYFIPNRSFDLGDITGDMLGAMAGVWFWTKRYIKKIDPCRNRGRNQN